MRHARSHKPSQARCAGVRVVLAALVVGLTVSGCARFDSWVKVPVDWFRGSDEDVVSLVERGFAAMQAGNLGEAEALNQRALAENPNNPFALLNQGVIYQRTNRPQDASMLYRRLIELDSPTRAISAKESGTKGERLADIGATYLAQIEGMSGASQEADLANLGFRALSAGDLIGAGIYSDAALGLNPANPIAMLNRGAAYQNLNNPRAAKNLYRALLTQSPDVRVADATNPDERGEPLVKIAEANLKRLETADMADEIPPPGPASMTRRFAVFQRLRDEGLIGPSEYEARREVNLDALLGRPTTGPGPEFYESVADRLRRLQGDFKANRIATREYAALRAVILDALIPAAPVPSLAGVEATEAERMTLLHELVAADVLTPEEVPGGLASMGAMRAPPAKPQRQAARQTAPELPGAAKKAPKSMIRPQARAAGKGPALGLHLASYRTVQEPEHGWRKLRRRHGAILEKLDHRVRRVDLGPGKGTYYRLLAGPVYGRIDAGKLCGRLKRRRVYCAVMPYTYRSDD